MDDSMMGNKSVTGDGDCVVDSETSVCGGGSSVAL
jgi:hypothetical protein